MAKAASRTSVSSPIKQVPQAKQVLAPVDRQSLLTMTEDEGMQVYEARSMLKLLEDMALFGEREITVSRGSLVVMMAAIREKLAFKTRLMPVDAAGFLQDRQ